ncbi:hypothetical protein [Brachybacterium hainanense]|uniref:Uncharacterized protein n=1 Tax=Brachybacterium hainanense TaxID=1541174 RepID=A0ABV6R826_9MICO
MSIFIEHAPRIERMRGMHGPFMPAVRRRLEQHGITATWHSCLTTPARCC